MCVVEDKSLQAPRGENKNKEGVHNEAKRGVRNVVPEEQKHCSTVRSVCTGLKPLPFPP